MKLSSIFFVSLAFQLCFSSAYAADWKLHWARSEQTPPALTVYDVNNKETTLSFADDRPTLVNFWATWCPPCVKEMPSLLALQETYKKQNLRLVIISEDAKGFNTITPLWNEKKWAATPDSYVDMSFKMMQTWEVQGMPSTFLIKHGKLIGKVEGGAEWDSPSLKKMLEEKLLK